MMNQIHLFAVPRDLLQITYKNDAENRKRQAKEKMEKRLLYSEIKEEFWERERGGGAKGKSERKRGKMDLWI